MSEEAEIRRKVKKASQILFLQRPRAPGVKGWELKKSLGADYMKIIEILDSDFDKINLKVKVVCEGGEECRDLSSEHLDRARFFITMKSPPSLTDIVTTGWRIDDMSMLAATIAYILSKHGKATKKDVVHLLREKFPSWKVDMNIARFIRQGYIIQDKDDNIVIGWRTRAEIDQKMLMNLILSTVTSNKEP